MMKENTIALRWIRILAISSIGLLPLANVAEAHSTIERSTTVRLEIDDTRYTALFRYSRYQGVGTFVVPIAIMKDTEFTGLTMGIRDAASRKGFVSDGTMVVEGPFNSVLLKSGEEWNGIGMVDISRLPDFVDVDSVEAFQDLFFAALKEQLSALLRKHYTKASEPEQIDDGNAEKPPGVEREP